MRSLALYLAAKLANFAVSSVVKVTCQSRRNCICIATCVPLQYYYAAFAEFVRVQ